MTTKTIPTLTKDEPVSLRTPGERQAYRAKVGAHQATADAARYRELIEIPLADESLTPEQMGELDEIIYRAAVRDIADNPKPRFPGEVRTPPVSWEAFDQDVETLRTIRLPTTQLFLDDAQWVPYQESQCKKLEEAATNKERLRLELLAATELHSRLTQQNLQDALGRGRWQRVYRGNSRLFGRLPDAFAGPNCGIEDPTKEAPHSIGNVGRTW
jgi:hypothetical protein